MAADVSTEDLEAKQCRDLWCAVVNQCWDDVFHPSFGCLVSSIGSVRDVGEYRHEALMWLVSNSEPFKSDRETVCSLAGVNPDALRDRALKAWAASAPVSRTNSRGRRPRPDLWR